MKNKGLLLQQVNHKMADFTVLNEVSIPSTGWIHTIRKALGMSMQQLGNKLQITKQGVLDIEKREKEGAITIKAMKELAQAMDMTFVYGFVPKDGSLNALIDRKATELATKIVLRTANSMKLEDQANSDERLKKAIKERAEEIKNEMPKLLWD